MLAQVFHVASNDVNYVGLTLNNALDFEQASLGNRGTVLFEYSGPDNDINIVSVILQSQK
jgi:hypothetical protein